MQNHVISDQLSHIMEISRDGKFPIVLAESIDLEIYKHSHIPHPRQHPSLQFREKFSIVHKFTIFCLDWRGLWSNFKASKVLFAIEITNVRICDRVFIRFDTNKFSTDTDISEFRRDRRRKKSYRVQKVE